MWIRRAEEGRSNPTLGDVAAVVFGVVFADLCSLLLQVDENIDCVVFQYALENWTAGDSIVDIIFLLEKSMQFFCIQLSW